MKGIGAFVLVLLVALGVVMYVVTRPPDRVLDAEGQAWVDERSSQPASGTSKNGIVGTR